MMGDITLHFWSEASNDLLEASLFFSVQKESVTELRKDVALLVVVSKSQDLLIEATNVRFVSFLRF